MEQIDNIIKLHQKYFYAEFLLIIVELIALIVGLIYSRKTIYGKLFICYIAFDLFLLIIDNYLITHPNVSKDYANFFISYTNPLVSLVEISAYYYFFYNILSGNNIKIILKILYLTFLAIMSVYLITKFRFFSPRLDYVSYTISVIGFVFLLPPCFKFFYDLLTIVSEIKLTKRPSFWIVTGIFFFTICSIPYFLLEPYFYSNKIKIRNILVASFFYIPYILNVTCLLRAFRCTKTLAIYLSSLL